MTLTIWGRKSSSNVQALMWCIGELGLAYERHDVGHHYGGNDTPEFMAMNPNGTVPVLRDGNGPPLWETGAIIRYLAARYGSDTFWPADPWSEPMSIAKQGALPERELDAANGMTEPAEQLPAVLQNGSLWPRARQKGWLISSA